MTTNPTFDPQWTKPRLKQFWDACNAPDGFDYNALQNDFGAPDPSTPAFSDWMKTTTTNVVTAEIAQAQNVMVLRQDSVDMPDGSTIHEIGIDIDGRIVNAIGDLAEHIKALIAPQP
ncbi:MAG: hypothetical protein LRZ85_01005 [Alphaproteobacteria bacterium]|nr:hypothetical protein [Alphaproteobacteria bacterium]MCD8525909.1 hypothetical protein [Alphaproteobacteria bacterium]MCD8570006.1 hypothetical protein [Alphaproteobacteria bacterium]